MAREDGFLETLIIGGLLLFLVEASCEHSENQSINTNQNPYLVQNLHMN